MQRQLTADELDELYRSIGRSIWHLQYVEDALNHLITIRVEIKTPGALSAEEAREKLDKHRRNTLGTSMRIAKENGVLSESIQARLVRFKDERDWIVHRSLNTHGERLYTDEGRFEILDRLNRFYEEASQLQRLITNELSAFIESQGISTAEVEKRARAHVEQLKGLA